MLNEVFKVVKTSLIDTLGWLNANASLTDVDRFLRNNSLVMAEIIGGNVITFK